MTNEDSELRLPAPAWVPRKDLPAMRGGAVPAVADGSVVEELPATVTAWDVFRRLQTVRHVLFLDSAVPHQTLGRYSFLTADPFEWITSRGDEVILNGDRQGTDPFTVLANRLSQHRVETVAGLPPFQGGAAGLFGYDLCHPLAR